MMVDFAQCDPSSPEAQMAMSLYFAELQERFTNGFDAQSALASDSIEFQGPGATFILVHVDRAVVGCGAIQRFDASTAEIKRMWISARSRSAGLGRRLLGHLEAQASDLGYTSVLLDTNETLREAIAMYETAGYRSIERYNDNPYAHRWFAKTLEGITQ